MELPELLFTPLEKYTLITAVGIILATPVFLGYLVVCSALAGKTYTESCKDVITTRLCRKIVLSFGIMLIFSVIVANMLFFKFGYSVQFFVAMCFAYPMLALAAIDFKTQMLPDIITRPLIILGLVQGYFGIFTDLQSSVLGAIAGYWILWSVNFCFRLLRGMDGMGYGDFKLLSAIGAWAGIKTIPLTILFSSIIGIFVALIIIKVTKDNMQAPTPFGPTLVFTGFVAFIYGNDIIGWYLRMLQV